MFRAALLMPLFVVAVAGCATTHTTASSTSPPSSTNPPSSGGQCVATTADFEAADDKCIPTKRSLLCAIHQHPPGGPCKLALTFASSRDVGCRDGSQAGQDNPDGYIPEPPHLYCAHVYYLKDTKAAHRVYLRVLKRELANNLLAP